MSRFERKSSVVMVEGDLASRYTGRCAGCDAERVFEFRIPANVLPPPATGIRFGGTEPSQLLDPGEWLAVATDHARRVPARRPLDDVARHGLGVAIAALDEVLKFIPLGEQEVPGETFRTRLGRESWEREPGRFRAVRLRAVRDAYMRILEPAEDSALRGPRLEAAGAPPEPADPLDTGTWRWERGCITWYFDLPVERGRSPLTAMADNARRVLTILGGFAVPATAEWTTTSAGEDAVVHERGTVIDEAALAATFRDHPDVEVLVLWLDLILTTPDGAGEAMIRDGAKLIVEDASGKLAIDLRLNVDVHARRTFGRIRDNARLARLNAPRLTAFLARLQQATGARLQTLDAADYREELSEWRSHLIEASATDPEKKPDAGHPDRQGRPAVPADSPIEYAAILDDPNDPALRRALAAHDDERGDPRGELIRLQLQIADLKTTGVRDAKLFRRERELIQAHGRTWAAPLADLVSGHKFHRGLIGEVTVPLDRFLDIAPSLFAAAPIQHLNLTRPRARFTELLRSPHLTRLSSLSLSTLGLGDEDAEAIARAEMLKTLRYLSLAHNRIGPTGVEALAASPHLARLDVLDLTNNPGNPIPRPGAYELDGSITAIERPALANVLVSRYGTRPWLEEPSDFTNADAWYRPRDSYR